MDEDFHCDSVKFRLCGVLVFFFYKTFLHSAWRSDMNNNIRDTSALTFHLLLRTLQWLTPEGWGVLWWLHENKLYEYQCCPPWFCCPWLNRGTFDRPVAKNTSLPVHNAAALCGTWRHWHPACRSNVYCTTTICGQVQLWDWVPFELCSRRQTHYSQIQ